MSPNGVHQARSGAERPRLHARVSQPIVRQTSKDIPNRFEV